ncbi:MAG: conjugative transfer system coupling protein TraD [Candidatus Competibacteraceae bacterium]|nr:conjugative transfer system coupling protein TraD [Candidatus Competibacteraceae bacterium]MCB1805080.1 conjugative transfer system coupling protein TraD [Candidatus Competibacteraceae bacterium]MCB1810248.1 conjugative transfer system coupling protein TraD [Candidatus Competibacteraceae bacterium]
MPNYPIEALLRPPVEWSSSLAAASLAALALRGPDVLLMTRPVAWGVAGALGALALVRFWQGIQVLRYQRGLCRARRYTLAVRKLQADSQGLFLGRGFRWTARHTQRLWDATRAHNRRYVEQRGRARRDPLSGLPALHGVGLLEGEQRIVLPAAERQGHVFYVGTTGVGKTRAAEVAIIQDIRSGEPVICMDPKGDPDLFRRMHFEAHRAGRPFYFFHLGYPDHSARYNPIGRFSRITEVATRIANQLPSEGNSEAFRQFAWLFTHVIARALVALGEKPDYRKTLQHMNHIESLLVRYFEHWFDQQNLPDWRNQLGDHGASGVKVDMPRHLKGRDPRALELVRYYKAHDLYDPVADGLRRAFEYEKTFFDKISVAVQPLLEKLLSGRVGELINPDYSDLDDPRPVLDWQSVIRARAVVYCGFDALTDPEVAGVVGQSMIADLVAFAGELYKHGLGSNLANPEAIPETRLHLDEFSELVRGPEIIQALNKGRGAGLRFSVYTQTLADIAAGLGNRERAQQVVGNVSNTIVMLRVADLDTAELLSDRLGQVEVNMLMLVSGATDSSTPDSPIDFTSTTQERISSQTTTLLEPGYLMQLPRGHAFVLMAGGQLYKVQFPELIDPPRHLPSDLDAIARDMTRRYRSAAGVELQPTDALINRAALWGRTTQPVYGPVEIADE